MKQIFTSKILRKFLILSCLVIGLVFVTSSDNTQVVQAFPCCSECPGASYADMYGVCETQCGAISGTCFDNCMYYGERCWRMCRTCGGGPGGGGCYYNTDCPYYVADPPQENETGVLFGTCVGGNCVY